MDSFELNKIIGAILGTLLFVMGAGFVAEAIYSPIQGRGPGYSLPEPEGQTGAETAEPETPAVPLGTLLASANVEQGANSVRKCESCHNFGEGEANKQGPGLYGVVGRLMGSHEGFAYSDGMLAHNAAGDTWTYENLDAFLTGPKAFMPGTKMNFGGVADPEERANILAYLATLSATPVPFPPPEAAAAAEAPAAEGAAQPEPAAEAPAAETPAVEGPTQPEPASEAPAAVPTEGDAVSTPTETQSETPVEGTPTTSGTGGTETPATDAPAAPEAPAQ
jgi:cytochrome c